MCVLFVYLSKQMNQLDVAALEGVLQCDRRWEAVILSPKVDGCKEEDYNLLYQKITICYYNYLVSFLLGLMSLLFCFVCFCLCLCLSLCPSFLYFCLYLLLCPSFIFFFVLSCPEYLRQSFKSARRSITSGPIPYPHPHP